MTSPNAPCERETATADRTRGPISVLIVEDNPDHATLARAALEESNFWSLDITTTVASAFKMICAKDYGVLLVDYRLPDGNGLDLLDWVKKDSAVIMMTGQGDERVAVQAFKSGVFDYVVKDALFRTTLVVAVEQAIARLEALKRKHTSPATQLPP